MYNKHKNILKPLSTKKLKKYEFIGFDIETITDNNIFYLGGLTYYKNNKLIYKKFYDKIKMIKFILRKTYFRNNYIVASNLMFDLTCLFYNTPYWNDFKLIFRGGNIIYAEIKTTKKKQKIKFIDTCNYLFTSVKNLGKIINEEKLPKPYFLGHKYKDNYEKNILEEYNKQDCFISMTFMYFLQRGVNEAGGNLKITIASTSFDIWRRNFLKIDLIKEEYVLKENINKFIFKGYYGGRTEIFKRGKFENIFYYDINSLYPSVMKKFYYPLPNTIKNIQNPNKDNIINYEGVSEVEIESSYIDKPFLPFRNPENKKLIFPYGRYTGVYNHNELRFALELGYKIIKVNKQIIYTKVFNPFIDFVDYFYNERIRHKKNNSKMEVITKLILNSLYGKFGQKIINETEVININNIDYKTLNKKLKKDFYKNENMLIINNEKEYKGLNQFPIIASYVTSWARILMYKYINNEDVIYTDTDSLFTTTDLNINSKELGYLKLEGKFKEGYFIKPKMYYLFDEIKNDYKIKIKGLTKANIKDFNNILEGETILKTKFTKLKESIRQNLKVNSIMEIPKKFGIEDNKRVWNKNKSSPIKI